MMKTILTSFDFMQNFDFILTYKISNVSTRLITGAFFF